MKKIINLNQKLGAEYSCQVCLKNEAVIKIQGSAWLAKVQGKFCENCAIKKIKYWYRQDIPKNTNLAEFAGNQSPHEILPNLAMKDLLNEIARRMKKSSG